jgi:predicted alpha/beta superfamily hydrolase
MLLGSNLLMANTKPQPFKLGEQFIISSKVLNENRDIYVFTPRSYQENNQKYPVIYLLDAETNFVHTAGIVDFLSMHRLMADSIVVGIPNTNRLRDLSPSAVKDSADSGGADAFLQFIKTELMPFVQKTFRVESYNTIIGHSLAGLFSLHAMLQSPDLFQSFIIISPYLVWDEQKLLKSSDALLKKIPSPQRILLFVTVGKEPILLPSIQQFKSIIDKCALPQLESEFSILQNEGHGQEVHKSIYAGFSHIYRQWPLPVSQIIPDITLVKAHYDRLSTQFGYRINPQADVLNNFGYQLMDKNMFKDAIKMLDYCLQLYPDSWYANHNLGYCYQQLKDKTKAIHYYQQSVKLNPKNTTALERIQKLKNEK